MLQSLSRITSSQVRNLSNLAELKRLPEAHVPVMARQVLDYLKPGSNQLILDGTFGAGGHSRRLLNSSNSLRIVALDRDPVGFNYAQELSNEFPGRVLPLHGKFSDLPQLLQANGLSQNSFDGMLFDYGCSSMQFDEANRGFAVSKCGPLDMRMDQTDSSCPTAADVLAAATEEDLYKIIKYYGEEKNARKIARAIIETRYMLKRLHTTQELADIVQSVFGEDIEGKDKLQRPAHIATKTFQALRIFVNNELNEINYGLLIAFKYLKIGGRLVTITFHSLEDTIVKRHLTGNMIANNANPLPMKYCSASLNIDAEVVHEATINNWRMLHKHVIVPQADEVDDNPRSRSAKLRAAVRIR